ncbi:MAG: DUF1304 domain-containing protein [Vulcanimicrobiaceae bacterium]
MVASILVGLVALIHAYILILEVFLWETPRGQRAFGNTPVSAAATKTLAANQGLYNGFLALGLIVGFVIWHDMPMTYFFLGCVIVAALFGAATTKIARILLVQGLPALLAVIALYLAK